MNKSLVLLLTLALFASPSWAQQPEIKKHSSGPRRQLATIVFSGLGGAILGLSTLSFYGRPQDQLSNIAIGFAVGVIAGTAYVTFRSATTHDYYDEPLEKKDGAFAPPPPLLKPTSEVIAEMPSDEILDLPEAPRVLWSPLIQTSELHSSTSLGGRILITF